MDTGGVTMSWEWMPGLSLYRQSSKAHSQLRPKKAPTKCAKLLIFMPSKNPKLYEMSVTLNMNNNFTVEKRLDPLLSAARSYETKKLFAVDNFTNSSLMGNKSDVMVGVLVETGGEVVCNNIEHTFASHKRLQKCHWATCARADMVSIGAMNPI